MMLMQLKTLIFFGFLFGSVLFLVLAALLPSGLIFDIIKILFLIIAMFLDILAFSSRFYTYLLVPIIQQRKRNIILSNEDPYWFSTSMDAVIRKKSDDFVATVYISIPLYKSATEMSDEEKIEFSMQVSRLIGLSKDPVRYTAEMFVMNKDAYIQSLRDRISEVETEESDIMQKTPVEPSKIARIKGKLSMWNNILDKVVRTQSYELGSYVTVSALGTKEFEAVSLAQERARELISGIGAIFGISPIIITGKDILKYIEPEYLIPFSTVNEELSKKIEESII